MVDIRVKIPKELEHLEGRIEESVNREVKAMVMRFEVLRRVKGCLKTEKTWEELEVEVYDYEYFCR